MTSYSLGVDLGTTFTAAATVDETGVPTMVGLGNRAMQIPSVVHIGTDGSTLVGELAERQAALAQIRAETEASVKVMLGDKPFKRYQSNGAWWLNNIAPPVKK